MPSSHDEGIEQTASRIRGGDRRTLSRALSRIEDQSAEGRSLLDRLYNPDQKAHRVGITGPPGSGKSTLVNNLTLRLRQRGERVGILAVDPSSPFTGGAILGDRIRMQDHSGDDGVFIRSMASRGSLGGLASTTDEAAELLEAAGFQWILLETVGVGQSEMEVVEAADTTVIVLVPESGDAVQMMKAGLMEGGDVFVINKYDRQGGDQLLREITLMLELRREQIREHEKGRDPVPWEPPVCCTVAFRGDGVDQLLTSILTHREFLTHEEDRSLRQRERRISRRLRTQFRDRFLNVFWDKGRLEEWIAQSRQKVLAGESSPYALVDERIERFLSTLLEGQNGGNRE